VSKKEENEGSSDHMRVCLLAYAPILGVKETCSLINDDIGEVISSAECRMMNGRADG
jgi:hypothetical protein